LHSIRVDRPTDWPTCNVYILADLHIGDPHCDMAAVNAQIRRIQDDPHGVAICNGDLLNTALKTSVSDVYGEVLKPIDQIVAVSDLLMPIKEKIIGVTTGNHENRVYRNDGIDIMRIVCRELGIEDKYGPDGVMIFFRFGRGNMHTRHPENPRQLFMIYATHGSGGGRKEGSKAMRLAELADIVDADIYIRSHVHMPLIMRERFYRTNTAQSAVHPVDRLYVNTAATLEYGGYAQQKEFKPASLKAPIIRLNAKAGTAEAIL